MRSWLRWFTKQGNKQNNSNSTAPRRRRPALEVLEDRVVPAFNLTISTNPTVGVTLINGVVTATQSGANVNVLDIRDALLLGNDVAINNGAGGSEAGNITWLPGADLNYGGTFARSLVITADPSSTNGAITLQSQVNTTTTLHQFYGAQGDLVIDNALRAGGGTVVLIALAGEISETANGFIIAANLSASATGAITLDQDNDVTTGVFAAVATNSGQGVIFHDINDLTIGSVGTTNPVEGVTTNDGAIEITTAAGHLVVLDDVDAGAADILLRAGGGESIFRNNAVISNSGGNTIDIAGNRMILDGAPGTNAISAGGGGRVILHATSAGRPINLTATDPTGALNLSDAELDTVTTAGVLQVGDGIEGNVAVPGAVNPNNAATLALITNGGISGAGPIAVANLRLGAQNAVSLTGGNNVGVLAGEVLASGQPFTFNNAGPLTVGTVDGVAGVSANNGAINITTGGGALTINGDLDAGSANIVVTAGPANSGNPADVLTVNADISASGGNNITLGGNDLVVNAATVAVNGAGDIALNFAGAGGTATFNSGAILSAVNGDIDLTAGASITLNGSALLQTLGAGGILLTAGDDLTVNAGATVSSGAAATLRANDVLTLAAGGVVQASGAVTLSGGFNGSGGSVVFLGTATGASVTVQGGNGNDTFVINPTSTAAVLAVEGLAGSDTFDITPNAATTINVVGGLPTPPANPGDMLDVDLSGTTNPTLTSTTTPSGLQGSYTFGNRMTVNFSQIETLTSAADVAVTMSDSPDPVLAGGAITYTITVSNLGDVSAQNVQLLDTIPANTTFVSFTQNFGPGFNITTPSAGGTGDVTATIASLEPGQTATFTLVVQTDASLANNTVITNTASLTTDSSEASTLNNSATATTRIGPVSFAAAGAAQGQRPRVAVYSRTGVLVANFLAYPNRFKGGVRVAIGDVNGDGTADIFTFGGPGPRQLVQVIDGAQLSSLGAGRVPASALLRSFFVGGARFQGGLFVAVGDVNGDGSAEVIVSMGAGLPRVFVFDGDTGARIANFKAYANNFKRGVTVAAGDVNGDLRADIIVGPQRGAQRVLVIDGTRLPAGGGRVPNASLLGSFFPLQPGFAGGFNVAAGDVNGDLRADIIVAAASGAPPIVKVVNAVRLHQTANSGRIRNSALLANQLVFAQSYRGGVQVGSMELDLDGLAEVLVGTGPNRRILRGIDVLRNGAIELNRRLPFVGDSIGGA